MSGHVLLCHILRGPDVCVVAYSVNCSNVISDSAAAADDDISSYRDHNALNENTKTSQNMVHARYQPAVLN